MSHKKLRSFIVKVSVLGYFPLSGSYIYIYIYIYIDSRIIYIILLCRISLIEYDQIISCILFKEYIYILIIIIYTNSKLI